MAKQTRLKRVDFLNTRDTYLLRYLYDNDCPIKDRYFVGIEIDKENKAGTIYHDRELTEADIIHELLHVKYPNKSEDWINKTENIISNQ